MSLLVITGTQNRHLSILPALQKYHAIEWWQYKRAFVPQSRNQVSDRLKAHLDSLRDDETSLIGKYSIEQICSDASTYATLLIDSPGKLNSALTIDVLKQGSHHDATLVYGAGIIKEELYNYLPKPIINIHGGISPYYKGSSTLLYTLLMGQPELLGMTIHDIDLGIDSGDIYAHIFPELMPDMRPTEMFASCQKSLIDNISQIMSAIVSRKLNSFKQSIFGRTFMERDYRESHLSSIYNMYNTGFYREQIPHIINLRTPYKVYPWKP